MVCLTVYVGKIKKITVGSFMERDRKYYDSIEVDDGEDNGTRLTRTIKRESNKRVLLVWV